MKRLFYIPFAYKLILSYIAFLLAAVIAVGYFAYQNSMQSLRDKTRDNMQNTLRQMRDNIEYRTSDVERIAQQIYYDYNMQNVLRRYEQGWYSYEATSKVIMPTLDNLLNYTSSNIWIVIYIDNDRFPEYYYNRGRTNPLLTQKRYEIFHMKRITEEPWVQQLDFSVEASQDIRWEQVEEDEGYGNLSLIRQMDDIRQETTIGLIRVTIQIGELLTAVDFRRLSDVGSLVVTDAQGKALFASGPGTEEGGSYMSLSEPLESLGWELQARIPESVFDEGAEQVRRLTLLVCVVSVLVLTLVGVVVSGFFSRRIRKIVSSLHAFREGDFHKRIAYRGRDEFAQIGAAFNEMGANIEELIRTNYVADLRKKEAELESLQAQINPHFLYNTLSSISRLAQLGDTDRLQQMVQGLAQFYRLSLNEGKIFTTVEKELQHAQAYIDIQRLKYGNRLQVYYEIDEAALPFTTVKLVLQPFIENALEHAWYGPSLGLKLTVCKSGNDIVFRIIDNGVGMRPELLRQLSATDGPRIGYGIYNVDSRIKLQYSNMGDYGVAIASRPGAGTGVEIVIPCRKGDGDADGE